MEEEKIMLKNISSLQRKVAILSASVSFLIFISLALFTMSLFFWHDEAKKHEETIKRINDMNKSVTKECEFIYNIIDRKFKQSN